MGQLKNKMMVINNSPNMIWMKEKDRNEINIKVYFMIFNVIGFVDKILLNLTDQFKIKENW